MNPLPAALPRSQSSAGSAGNAAAISTTASPTSVKGKRSRKRESSSASELDGYEGSVGDKRRQPGVKRACNECRQQKLRCDVVTEPLYTICTRCRRLNLECKIESNFRRVGKRSKNAEMEREIVELRRQLGLQQAPPPTTGPTIKASLSTSASPTISHLPAHMDQYMGSEEAVASLMDLRSGLEGGSFLRSPNAQLLLTRRIGDIVLTHDRVQELFQHFFTCYHPFIPFLDPTRTTDEYYLSSPLLFWTIISVATRRYDPSLLTSLAVPLSELLWKTIAEVPQNYIVVKALYPTFMLSGLMMQVAMQIGLHRPSHAQDFTKFKVKLREEELRDRVRTWATCNAVAQRVATGYGQPPSTFYDWTLASSGAHEPSFRLPDDVYGRLLIEKFSNKVTKALYSNRLDPVGLVSDNERSVHTTFLTREYEDLEQKLQLDGSFSLVYLRAAKLHLHLSAFFDSPSSSDYRIDLFALWRSTTSFLEAALHVESAAGNVLVFSTNYILQMIIAAGFSLLKLMNSFFASHVDIEYGRNLFNRTIQAIRSISVFNNDLPNRLAEVLAQLWRSSGAGSRRMVAANDGTDSSLRLKVKCRMSMSLVFDSVWRWREEFQAQGRGNLESALKNPTNPDSAVESSATSLADNNSLAHSALLAGTLTPSDGFGGESHYEVFDPLNWMLDGLVDLPYDLSMAPDMEVQGLT
ncbi:MAG: hypothetical protein ASARMPRED_007738 [Alectoria sarmentosa]|nr:MAG: hypothetical protein ASARMPRED_007738 [Alectoria sarmentosa]